MKDKSKPLIYYCLAGVGQGNASRLEAIWQELEGSCSFKIFCWGKSFDYLSKRFRLHPDIEIIKLKSYELAHDSNGLSLLKLIVKLPLLFWSFLSNCLLISGHLKQAKADLSLHDSDYHLYPFLIRGIQRISISQSPMIVHNRNLLTGFGLRVWFSFYLYEFSEYLFIRLFSSAILCPSFDLDLKSESKIVAIKPIVRREFRRGSSWKGGGIVTATGASGIGSEILIEIAQQYGTNALIAKNGTRYEAIDPQGLPLLSKFEVAIIQAGHVLISECLSLEIPFYPIPIENHPEQMINKAIIARDFYPELAGTIQKFLTDFYSKKMMVMGLDCCGAYESAKLIKRFFPSEHRQFTADDWGLSKSINEAILELARVGKVRIVSIMVNMECTEYLLDELLQTEVEFSLHFNLTEGRPLSSPRQVKSLVNSKGQFRDIGSFLVRLLTGRINFHEMSNEFSVQLRRASDLVGGKLKEVDGHHHIHLVPGFIISVISEIKRHNVERIRCPQDESHLGSYLGGSWLRKKLALEEQHMLVDYGYLNLASRKYLKFENVIAHPGLDTDIKKPWTRRRYTEYLFLKGL